MGASLRDRVLMLRTEPLCGVSALRVSPDLRKEKVVMSEAVAAIYDNWGNRASSLEPEVRREGERVFKVGYQYSVTVPDDPEQPAKVAHLYRRWGASENPMPNMEVQDGELRIPVEDLADLILRRIPADELAEGLWRDETVRARFVDCMAERYMGEIPDADRRELLRKINAAIHSVSLDEAITRLNKMEEGARCWSAEYRWRTVQTGHYEQLYARYNMALHELREAGKRTDEEVSHALAATTTPERLKEFFEEGMDPVVKESVGEQWRDSRDFWRDLLMKAFPPPASADTHPKGGDSVEHEAPFMSGAVGEAETPTPSNPSSGSHNP